MGILPLLVVAVATISGYEVADFNVTRLLEATNEAVMTAECRYTSNMRRKRSLRETTVDLIVAVDSSFCNHYRLEQVKSTVRE